LGRIQIYWDVTGSPWYPGYRTLTVALEPIVEWLVGDFYMAGGGSGTHVITGANAGFSGEALGLEHAWS
jgi:hypothetical protein